MKNIFFIVGIIVAIIVFTYDPAVKTMTGELVAIEEDSITITCSKNIARFKPIEDIGHSCIIDTTDTTVVEGKLQQGQSISIELVEKVQLKNENVRPVAKIIKSL